MTGLGDLEEKKERWPPHPPWKRKKESRHLREKESGKGKGSPFSHALKEGARLSSRPVKGGERPKKKETQAPSTLGKKKG